MQMPRFFNRLDQITLWLGETLGTQNQSNVIRDPFGENPNHRGGINLRRSGPGRRPHFFVWRRHLDPRPHLIHDDYALGGEERRRTQLDSKELGAGVIRQMLRFHAAKLGTDPLQNLIDLFLEQIVVR